jgi:hypothetical protein
VSDSSAPERLPCNELAAGLDYGKKWKRRHNSVCDACGLGGNLVMCDFCNICMHSLCFDAPQCFPPVGDWACRGCTLAAQLGSASAQDAQSVFANVVLLESGLLACNSDDAVSGLPAGGAAVYIHLSGREFERGGDSVDDYKDGDFESFMSDVA